MSAAAEKKEMMTTKTIMIMTIGEKEYFEMVVVLLKTHSTAPTPIKNVP